MAVTVSRETHPRVTLKGANSGTVNSGILVGSGDGNRVSMTFTATAEPIIVIPEGPVSDAQLEAGAFETSYIPNTADSGTVTRSADIASIPVSAFGYNQDAGTVVVEAQTKNTGSSFPYLWQLDRNISNTRIACTFRVSGGAVRMFVQNSGSTDASLYRGSPLTETTEVTTAGAWKTDDVAFSYDGSTTANDTNGCAIPLADTLRLGITNLGGLTALNGHIKSIQYYPRRLTDAQLQELTS